MHDATLPDGALVVREMKDGTPTWEAKWRYQGKQQKRRLGKAWADRKLGRVWEELGQESAWRERSGKPKPGYLSKKQATAKMASVIREHADSVENAERDEAARRLAESLRDFTLDDVAAEYLHWAEHVRGMRPSTLKDYRYSIRAILSAPQFEARGVTSVTSRDVREWRDGMLANGASPRTANKLRQLLANLYVYGSKEDTFGLPSNPVLTVEKVKERKPGLVDYYEPHEVEHVARIMKEGAHRTPFKRSGATSRKPTAAVERERENTQDATMVVALYFAGLRLGEAMALRWRDVAFTTDRLVISRSYSGDEEGPTKADEPRSVPLLPQLAQALEALSRREHFTGRNDLVFASVTGDFIDASAFRRRYKRACRVAELRPLRVHDLRHGFLSIAARAFAPHEVQRLAGHADVRTTARYMHAKQRPDEGDRLAAAFALGTTADPSLTVAATG
jgi:integrase